MYIGQPKQDKLAGKAQRDEYLQSGKLMIQERVVRGSHAVE
jgi:hypothetical protein